MYINYQEFCTLYDEIDQRLFLRLAFEADRILDKHTTGCDGLAKLRVAFPVDEFSVMAVKQCAANIINFLAQINEAEQSAALARGYSATDKGLQRKVISQVSSGSESITYSDTKLLNTSVDVAVSGRQGKAAEIAAVIRDYLSGITDANGVNLLYMGPYPRGAGHV